MIFRFIRYTQPGWQFNLVPKVAGSFSSCYNSSQLLQPRRDLKIFHNEKPDEGFETESAKLAELGYRLWNKGFLLESTQEGIATSSKMRPPSLKDEYRFIRKYWGTGWTVYAYLLRIITFKNPFKETSAFFKTSNIKRIDPFADPLVYDDYETYSSALLNSKPLVAVVIPTLNRYKYLKDVLGDLEKQRYRNFEVIVIDQSDEFDKAFYSTFDLDLKLFRQEEKLLWTARNFAVKNTNSDFLLFFDDDSRVEPNWIEEHLKCLDYFDADISAGVSLATVGQKISTGYRHFRWADQFDSGNAMVRRNVLRKIGLFDEQFNGQRMGDAEFGTRAFINGFRSISNPKASRVHLKVSTGGLRHMGHWDGFRPKKWFDPKPVPSVIYFFKKYYPVHLWKNAILIGIILSNVPYHYKRYQHMLVLSLFLSVVKSPVLWIQYKKSLRIADRMLQQGSRIDRCCENPVHESHLPITGRQS